jgi:hypothetical protein
VNRRDEKIEGALPPLPIFFFFLFVDRQPDSFAYVDFATPEAKQVAITMTESPLEGRRLLIKDGTCAPRPFLCIASYDFV